ncbi:glycosyltransferase N-terminal domain-containing protein [Algoriphagus boritolerans]
MASLGEYEQARPVLAALKTKRPEMSIVVSFF